MLPRGGGGAAVLLLALCWLAALEAASGEAGGGQEDAEAALVKWLLARQLVQGRAGGKRSRTTVVRVRFYPMAVMELDGGSQAMHLRFWLHVQWREPRLAWNASAHGGIHFLYLSAASVWRPDLAVDNTANDVTYLAQDNEVVGVTSHGDVTWKPNARVLIFCPMTFTRFPFDSQECVLGIVPWIHDAGAVQVQFQDPSVDLKTYQNSSEWDLVEILPTLYKWDSPDGRNYSALNYRFRLRRRSSLHVVRVLLPVLLLSLQAALVLGLPPGSGERVATSVSAVLALTVFLGVVGEEMPANAQRVPVLALYILLNLALGVLALLGNVLVIRGHLGPHAPPPPPGLAPAGDAPALEKAQAGGGQEGQGGQEGVGAPPCRAGCLACLALRLDRALFLGALASSLLLSLACLMAALL